MTLNLFIPNIYKSHQCEWKLESSRNTTSMQNVVPGKRGWTDFFPMSQQI